MLAMGLYRLKRGFWKGCWAGRGMRRRGWFWIGKFVGGFIIRIIELWNCCINCDIWVSVRIHARWCVSLWWIRWRKSKKWENREWILEVGRVGVWSVEWSKLSAHDYFETEKWWYVAVQYFVRMYRQLKVVVSLCVGWGLVWGWVLILGGLWLLKFRETKDNGWLFGKWGAVGKALVSIFESSFLLGFVDIFVLYSSVCASRRILFIDDENIPKNPANNMRATLACLFTCVCIAHVL